MVYRVTKSQTRLKRLSMHAYLRDGASRDGPRKSSCGWAWMGVGGVVKRQLHSFGSSSEERSLYRVQETHSPRHEILFKNPSPQTPGRGLQGEDSCKWQGCKGTSAWLRIVYFLSFNRSWKSERAETKTTDGSSQYCVARAGSVFLFCILISQNKKSQICS